MDIAKLMRKLECAWAHALPGREAAERDTVLPELWRDLRRWRPIVSASFRTWTGWSKVQKPLRVV
jgi:hypothetical protein